MNATTLRATHEPHRIAIFIGDATMPCIVQHALYNTRPFIHPLLAPDGRTVLTEDAPAHHSWQHGLYSGLNDVNGAGFWTEGLYEKHRNIDGSFHPRPLEAPLVKDDRVAWVVKCEWRSQAGVALLQEKQRWIARNTSLQEMCSIELTWTITAQIDLAFGRYDYGGLFLRMPFRKVRGGEALNSVGQRNANAEAQRARWCAVSMPIDNEDTWAGVALFDHPSNMQFPTPWRVDNELGIGPSPCIAGAWHLRAGESRRFRYGVLPFMSRASTEQIEQHFNTFVA